MYFEFDKVFGPPCSQEEVFEDNPQCFQSALDGFTAALPMARYCVCVCVCVLWRGGGLRLLVYPHRSKPRIMDLIKETHVRVQCIPMHQPFNLLTLILLVTEWHYVCVYVCVCVCVCVCVGVGVCL